MRYFLFSVKLQQSQLKEQKEKMLLSRDEMRKYENQVKQLAETEYNNETLNPLKMHIEAINELLENAPKVDSKLQQEARETFLYCRPFVSKETLNTIYSKAGSIRFSHTLRWEIFKIQDRQIQILKKNVTDWA